MPYLLRRLRSQRFNLKTIRLLSQVNRPNPNPIQPRPRTLNSDHYKETLTTERIGKKTDLMATRSYTSRRELEQHSFHPAVTVLVPLTAILLQAFLPRPFPRLAILDLPLIITVFFAVSRRNPVAGTLTGACIGLLQDALTVQPIGVNGMAKSVIGYIAASIGIQIDVENLTTRVIINFGFFLLNSFLLFLINRRLLGHSDFHLLWLHELLRAVINTIVALPIFFLLDNTKRIE
jgi:rod shape-determining protein MreD